MKNPGSSSLGFFYRIKASESEKALFRSGDTGFSRLDFAPFIAFFRLHFFNYPEFDIFISTRLVYN